MSNHGITTGRPVVSFNVLGVAGLKLGRGAIRQVCDKLVSFKPGKHSFKSAPWTVDARTDYSGFACRDTFNNQLNVEAAALCCPS